MALQGPFLYIVVPIMHPAGLENIEMCSFQVMFVDYSRKLVMKNRLTKTTIAVKILHLLKFAIFKDKGDATSYRFGR